MNTAQIEPPLQRAVSWNACYLVYLPALVIALGAGIALPAIPTLAKSFNVGFGLASGVVTAFLIGNVAGTIPIGWVIDRFGVRWVMISAPLVTALTAFLVAVAHSFTELLILRFIGGFAAQMWYMAQVTMISRDAPAQERGRLITWMFGMETTGKLAGPAIGGVLASEWGLGAPFVAYGVLAFLALFPALKSAVNARRGDERVKAAAPSGKQLSTRDLVLPRLVFFAMAMFAGLSRGPIGADLMHVYAAFAYDLGPRAIGYLATGAAIITWPIAFGAGWAHDRFGRKSMMAPGFAGVAVSMVLLALSAWLHFSLGWYIALFFFGVAAQAMTFGSVQTVGADIAPPEARGAFLGLWRFTGQGGSAMSPIFFALIAEQINYGSAFAFTALMGAMAAWLLYFRVPDTSTRG